MNFQLKPILASMERAVWSRLGRGLYAVRFWPLGGRLALAPLHARSARWLRGQSVDALTLLASDRRHWRASFDATGIWPSPRTAGWLAMLYTAPWIVCNSFWKYCHFKK